MMNNQVPQSANQTNSNPIALSTPSENSTEDSEITEGELIDNLCAQLAEYQSTIQRLEAEKEVSRNFQLSMIRQFESLKAAYSKTLANLAELSNSQDVARATKEVEVFNLQERIAAQDHREQELSHQISQLQHSLQREQALRLQANERPAGAENLLAISIFPTQQTEENGSLQLCPGQNGKG